VIGETSLAVKVDKKEVSKDTLDLYAKYSHTQLTALVMHQTGYKPPKKENDTGKGLKKKGTTVK
jgi:hypothetical protein